MAGLNESEIIGQVALGVISQISELPGLGSIINILQAVGVVIIIYFIFLIIRAFVQTRQALRIKQISKNVEEINKKMDILVGKKKK